MDSKTVNELKEYFKSFGVDMDEAIITSPTKGGGYLKFKLKLALDNFEQSLTEEKKG